MTRPIPPGWILIAFGLGACASSTGSTEQGEGLLSRAERAEDVDTTVRLPSTEAVLRKLIDHYVEPERLKTASFREEATHAVALHLPSILTEVDESSEAILVARSGQDRVLRVSCFSSGPVWGLNTCLRRLAFATTELVEDLDLDLLDRALATSLLERLDPHSRTLWLNAEACQFTASGCPAQNASIGIKLERQGEELTVFSVAPKSPGEKAGIRPGDKLITIDGLPASALSAGEAEFLLAGAAKTRVSLSVEREGDPEPKEISCIRSPKKAPVITSRKIKNITYIRLREFARGSSKQVREALKKSGRVQGLILDLRDNPGGLVDEALEIANAFLDRGTIMSIEIRQEELRRIRGRPSYIATSGDTEPFYPIIVLVNERSASASELLAGALQDNNRAVVMGQTTYGKGSTQVPFAIPNGLLMVTTRRYLTSTGRHIQGIGVRPDIWLRPVRVGARLRLRHWPTPLREADRKHALDTKAGRPDKPKPKPLESLGLSFLEGEDGEGKTDRVAHIASELLRKCRGGKRDDMLERIGPALQRTAETETAKIRQAIQSSGFSIKAAKSGASGDQAIEVSIEERFELEAGQTGTLNLSVKNAGDQEIGALSFHTESENPLLDGLERFVGHLGPGKTKATSMEVAVPLRASTRADPLRLVWHISEEETVAPQEQTHPIVIVREKPEPSLGLLPRFDDKKTGDGDGRIGPGETIEVCARAKNLGSTQTPEAVVSIDGRSGPIQRWNSAFELLEPLGPGQEKAICFEGKARKDLAKGTGIIILRFSERRGRILGLSKLKVETIRKGTKPRKESRADKEGAWPPSLQILAPDGQLATTSDRVTFRVRARSRGAELRDVTVYVGSKKRHYQIAESPDEIDLELEVAIEPGSSLVTARIRTKQGPSRTRSLRFHRLE